MSLAKNNRLKILVCKLKSQIVLFTSLITTVSDVLDTASRLKKLPDPPKIFVGGPHAEVIPGDFFNQSIDGVFFANQLEGILQVLDRILKASAIPPHHWILLNYPAPGTSSWINPPAATGSFITDPVLPSRHHLDALANAHFVSAQKCMEGPMVPGLSRM